MKICIVYVLRSWFQTVLTLGIISTLVTCVTITDDILDDLTPDIYFQNAQEATTDRDYQRAMRWYRAFMERYQNLSGSSLDQRARLLWAEYEIAFLHHKMGDDGTALILLQELANKYENPEITNLPLAPGILAKRIIKELKPSE